MTNFTQTPSTKPAISAENELISAVARLAERWNATFRCSSCKYSLPTFAMRKHDLKHYHELPIIRVAESLGLQLRRTGNGIWNVKDTNDPLGYTSLTISEKKNRWKRWSGKISGGVSQGSTIDLVMHVRDCTFKEALEFLSSRFL